MEVESLVSVAPVARVEAAPFASSALLRLNGLAEVRMIP